MNLAPKVLSKLALPLGARSISAIAGRAQSQRKLNLEQRPDWGLRLNERADRNFGGIAAWDKLGRPFSHGVWHGVQGIVSGNGDEFRRAKQQFGRIGSGGGWNGQSGRGRYDRK
ncbi:unnamed protein product, partial [Mesorhabditis belari]|uniref:Uncharacterized protein n=1 Tax=Mesorhabditis belari TaxID=2138241 RepID=A0AAF3FDD8_9BILA